MLAPADLFMHVWNIEIMQCKMATLSEWALESAQAMGISWLHGYATMFHWDCDRIMKSSTAIMVFHVHYAWDYSESEIWRVNDPVTSGSTVAYHVWYVYQLLLYTSVPDSL